MERFFVTKGCFVFYMRELKSLFPFLGRNSKIPSKNPDLKPTIGVTAL